MVNLNLLDKTSPFFGDSQLTAYPALQQPRKSAMPEYDNAAFISFFKRNMPALQGTVDIAIDGKTIMQLQPNQDIFDSSTKESHNKSIAIETYWLDGDTAGRIL
jgi:hypothetical protein